MESGEIWLWLKSPSLRRYDPDQVQRVDRGGNTLAISQFLRGTPLGDPKRRHHVRAVKLNDAVGGDMKLSHNL
jgi:hypothetical protein